MPVLCFQLLGNFLQWYGILSNKTLQELSIDGLLNRYILMAFQNSEYGDDSIKKAQSVSNIPPKKKKVNKLEITYEILTLISSYHNASEPKKEHSLVHTCRYM